MDQPRNLAFRFDTAGDSDALSAREVLASFDQPPTSNRPALNGKQAGVEGTGVYKYVDSDGDVFVKVVPSDFLSDSDIVRAVDRFAQSRGLQFERLAEFTGLSNLDVRTADPGFDSIEFG